LGTLKVARLDSLPVVLRDRLVVRDACAETAACLETARAVAVAGTPAWKTLDSGIKPLPLRTAAIVIAVILFLLFSSVLPKCRLLIGLVRPVWNKKTLNAVRMFQDQ
jgi:hypothetical protein